MIKPVYQGQGVSEDHVSRGVQSDISAPLRRSSRLQEKEKDKKEQCARKTPEDAAAKLCEFQHMLWFSRQDSDDQNINQSSGFFH